MTQQNKSKLSLIQCTLLIFTLTSGGPFGMEAAIQSGGVCLTLIALIIIPFIYSLPQSLMCSELGSMMPSYHGYIVWSFRAFKNDGRFGHFLGFYNAIGCTLAMAEDIPLYINVMLFYFEKFLLINFGTKYSMALYEKYLFKFVLIIFGGLVNIFNVETLGNSNLLLMILLFIPLLIGYIYTLPQTNIDNIMSTKVYNNTNEYELGLWVSTLFWCHSGFDSIGCLTADISFKKHKLIYAFFMALILDYIFYTIPILTAITQKCPTNNCWDIGYFYVAYNSISPYLGMLILIVGFLSSFAIYISELSIQARTFWALAQPFVLLTKNGNMFVETANGILYDSDMNIIENIAISEETETNIERIRIGMLPHWLCGTLLHKTGSPIRGVLLQSVLCCILIVFDFGFLVQATVLINGITWVIEVCSFLRMRYTEPNAIRPYNAPGGMAVAWLITIDKFIVVIVLLGLVLRDNHSYIFVTIGSIVVCVLWYIIYIWNVKHEETKKKLDTDLEREKEILKFGNQKNNTNYGSTKNKQQKHFSPKNIIHRNT